MVKLPSVASETIFANTSAPPKIVSSDFGNDEVSRQLIFGLDCATAGAASVVAAAAATPVVPAFRMNERRSMNILPADRIEWLGNISGRRALPAVGCTIPTEAHVSSRGHSGIMRELNDLEQRQIGNCR